MGIFDKFKEAKTEDENLDVLNEWYKKSELISINQYVQDISNNLKKIENTSGYLYQEGIDINEITSACSFIRAQLDSIAVNAQEREARKNAEESKMMLIAAKKLISSGRVNEGYKALYNIAKENKNTEVGKEALKEAENVFNNRKMQIERANGKKENTSKQA